MKKITLFFALLIAATVFAQNLPPTVFYSNLASGPSSGGQNNAGAFVTISGKGFGSSQGSSTVTVGGGSVSSYQSWSDSSITFQLGTAAKSGNIVVQVGSAHSNSVPFTVCAGHIYFVSSSGNNGNSGSYSAPWRSVVHAVSAMQPGDIVYLENGYLRDTTESNNSSLVLSTGGTSSAPMALVAYPKSTATIGSSTGATTGINITAGNWVLSGLTLRAAETAVSITGVSGVRLTNNDLSCPNAYGVGSCIAATGGSSFSLLGNNIHDNGSTTNPDLESYEAVYLLGSDGVEFGWNTVANTRGCNAVGFHSDSGLQYSLSVHDNYIHDTRCGAISLGTVDPSQGPVKVYNNIIARSGTGPAPGGTPEGYGYSAITIGGGSSTPAQIYNNTVYDAGAIGGAKAGAVRAFGAATLTNNIFDLLNGEQYISLDTNLANVSGSNNLFFGAGNPLGLFSDSVVGDPTFVSLSNNNFHLQAGSSAIDSGATVALSTDFDGVLRPQGAGYDIGAYEFVGVQTPAVGALSTSPSSLSFGTLTVGQSATTTTVLSNTGNASVTVSQVNSNNSSFQTSGISFPLTLSAGQSASLTVTFTPQAAGAISGTIAVASNASASTNIAVSGTGQAVPTAPSISLSPSSLTFASQVTGTTSATQAITLTNTGTAALNISGITASGDFAQTNNCSSSVAAKASCTIAVTFAPTATGTRTGAITFTDNAAASPQQVSLSGTATAPSISLSPSSLTFASQVTGTTSATQAITLTNTGTAALTIGGITASGDFAQTNNCASTVAANASCTIAVTFIPTATGTRTGAITFTDNAAASPQQVSLSGTATAPAVATLQASASALTFSSITTGTSSTQSVVITNSGKATATVSQISTGNSAFTVTGMTLPATIAAGGSITVPIVFTPAAAQTYTGTLAILSNATNPTLSVSLSGTGLAVVPISHSVALSWTDTASVSGYNVYRSTQSGASYTKINTSLAPSTSYTDGSVTAGTTYYYVVTAVDASGNESGYSSQVTAVVPTP